MIEGIHVIYFILKFDVVRPSVWSHDLSRINLYKIKVNIKDSNTHMYTHNQVIYIFWPIFVSPSPLWVFSSSDQNKFVICSWIWKLWCQTWMEGQGWRWRRAVDGNKVFRLKNFFQQLKGDTQWQFFELYTVPQTWIYANSVGDNKTTR